MVFKIYILLIQAIASMDKKLEDKRDMAKKL